MTASFLHARPPDAIVPHRTPLAADLASQSAAAIRHRIVIVGGGAGGLELAARLGDDAGRHGKAEIVLVDAVLTHLWKPLLHEIAAGTLESHENELDFLQQARRHHFRFHLGRLESVERTARRIWLAQLTDEAGMEIAPRRPLAYDTLVIAIGGIDNDFGTPGVREHALSLNTGVEARQFHRRLLALCARAEMSTGEPVHIVIVGGGATGVELAAELSGAADEIAAYGMQLRELRLPLRITLLEASDALLSALPDDVAAEAHADLAGRGIDSRPGTRVAEVAANSVVLEDGERVPADLTVWAAGVQGPEVLADLGGLETNRQRQLVVRSTLQTTRDSNIFALGDCACCRPDEDGPPVPPKAQAAQQQAELLARSLQRRIAGKPLLEFRYRERGNLISLGRERAVGNVDTPGGQRLHLGGRSARLGYWVLYRRHLTVLLGGMRTALVTLGQWLARRSRPKVKLH
ncbi:MAG: NAD(P)/FAD-dependent oxidoreductase [Thauera sp.]|nr:NAD(P)/FAD-dependent oxidoreductase [Thauera sp.]